MKRETTVIYTAQKTGLEKGKRYANPRFFDGKPKSGVTKVVVVGNWPAVVEAYKAKGVEVVQQEAFNYVKPSKYKEPPRDLVAKVEAEPVDGPSDEELRDMIEDATGNRPHHRTGREKLVAMLAEAGE